MTVSTRAFVTAACLVTALLAPLRGEPVHQATQKQPTPTFRVQVDYVEVDALVRDKAGHFVSDLKKDDFEILEDGKRQVITAMELMDVPVEAQSIPALLAGRRFESDVVSNDEPPGRVYLIVLDDLHVSPQRSAAAKRIAREFIERNVAPNDVAAVVTTTGARNTAQDFTSNRRLLLQAVEKFVGRKTMSPGAAAVSNTLTSTDPNAINATGIPMGTTTVKTADPGLGERVYNARSSLETLSQLATLAGTIRNRRKALVLVGEGIDYRLGAPGDISGLTYDDGGDFQQTMDQRAATRTLRDDLGRFIDAANRANVTVYAIDPRIYAQGGEELVDIASGVTQNTRNDHEVSNLGTLQDDVEASQDNLRTMASSTGGFAVTGSLKAGQLGYERIQEENSHYYILGYYPTNDKRDGKFRKIDVRVKRAGVEVVARKGYQAPKGQKAEVALIETKEGTSAPVREALMSALSTTGLPISVVAAPFRGTGGKASVLVMLQTPPGALKFTEAAGRIEGNIELSFVAVDSKGKTAGGEHLDVTMPLKPETRTLVERNGLLVQSRVAVPPGRYVLRVAARDAGSERVGAVHCDLEIPEYDKAAISMSGIVISSADTLLPNPRPDKALTNLLPGSPVVIRHFSRADQMGVLVEIYDTKLATPHDIDIITTATREDGREAYRHEDKRSSAELQGMQDGFGYLLQVPLGDMAPGSYLLRVEARSRLDVNNPVSRETTFSVK